MRKNDIFNNYYKYICYPVKNIVDTLKNGVLITDKDLDSCMNEIAYDKYDLEDLIKNKFDDFYKKMCKTPYIAIVKIPSYYLGFQKIDADFTPCMPLLKISLDYQANNTYIIPELILGIYNIDTKEYLENQNYNLFYNPNGLQFSDDQIYNIKSWGDPKDLGIALIRREISYELLMKHDEITKIFIPTLEYYHQLALTKNNGNNYLKKVKEK